MTAGRPWEAEYEALYREHAARLARLCRLLLRDPHEADEVVQEVFLKVVQIYEESNVPIAWNAWLTRVAVNGCRDRHRAGWWSRWQRRHDPIEGLEIADEMPMPDRLAAGRETRERIWHVFRQLPRRQREVFVLRHMEGWATADIARALGLRTGSVKRHLFRAVQRLRAALEAER